MKKIFALMLAIMMLLGMTSANAADNASQIGKYYKANTSTGALASSPAVAAGWQSYENGLVQVRKTIAATGTENLFDVTLEVKTSQLTTKSVEDAAVVIVVDLSTSTKTHYMDDGTTKRITAIKSAIKSFINSFSNVDPSVKRYIAIVGFNGLVDVYKTSNKIWTEVGNKTDTTNREAVKATVTNLTVIDQGATNIACAVGVARDLLEQSTVKNIKNRNIILVSDGEPTWHAMKSQTSGEAKNLDHGYDEDIALSPQGRHYGHGEETCHHAHYLTEQAMATSKWTGIGRYAIVCGPNSYVDCVDDGNCVAACNEAGPCSLYKRIVSWLSENCHFITYRSTTTDGLKEHFTTIHETIASVAQAQTVSDPMGAMIDYVSDGSRTNTSSYSVANEKITWNLSNAGNTTYTAKYRIRLDTLNASFKAGTFYATNGVTQLTWRKKNGNGQVIESGLKAYFNVPSVQGYSAQIKKVDSVTNQALAGAEFRLQHNSNCGCGSASTTWNNVTGVSGADGIITFTPGAKIPSGHTYTLTETKAPTGYVLDETARTIKVAYGLIDGKAVYEVGNAPQVTSVTIEKVWNDNHDQDGKRPESLTVTLTADGTPIQTVTLTAENADPLDPDEWQYTVSDLPKVNAAGEVISYTWIEDTPEDYELTGTVKYGHSTASVVVVMTNTHRPETVDISVKKVWDDAENQDGKRPTELKVTLSDGTEVTLNAANGWTATVNDLPKYANGVEIVYTWTEGTMPDGYSLTNTEENGTITTFTNSYAPEKTSATVKKVWDDAENQDGKRPAELKVTLSNGSEVTLNAANGWTATVNDLPKYANGVEIVYTWTEGTMPEGYSLTNTEKNATVTTLTNSYSPEKTSATVKKVWDDAENQDGKRPTELKVTLSNGTEVTLNAANGWTATVNDLPKYANGVEIVYTWTEGSMPEGYSLTNTEKNATVTTLTNSYSPEKTSATVKKVWDDAENQDGKRPAELKVTLSNGSEATLNAANGWTATVNDLPKYKDGAEIVYTWTEGSMPEGYSLTNTEKNGTITTFTNSYAPEKTSATVKKVWDDAENQDGKRPAELKVTLSNGSEVTLNAANGWTKTVNDLPKYKDGAEIVYTWTEGSMPEGYSLTNTEKNGTITTFTNSYAPEKTSATVKKVWDDAENQDGKRPAELKVTLSNGSEVTLNAENGWTATVNNLPKYANGVEIVYTWTEGAMPDGYSLTNTEKNGTITTFTNSYAPEKTSATVKKVWDDAQNQDGKRPAELKVTLSNGSEVTLNAANGWTATVNDLPKYKDGAEIVYTWTEGAMPEGYSLTNTEKNGTITTLTNSYAPEKTSATVKKVWDDAENQDGKRPAELKVTLSNGTEVTLNAANGWTATVNDLPKYANGIEIVYTWTEGAMPEGYSLTNTEKNGTITTFTNSYTPEKTSATVKKVWDDAENQDGKRPTELKVTLSNGSEVTLNAANGWTATVNDLPKYANSVEIVYTWTEGAMPEGYSLTNTEKNGTITTFTNSYVPEKTSATVKKVWDDAENQDGKRPTELKVTLSNGTEVTLNAANGWTATVNDLPKYKDGAEIVYTWTEGTMPEGYSLTNTEKNGTITTLTNSYAPEKTSATVKKVWDDAENQDGKRPTELKVTLSNGTEVTLNAANGWTATVNDLPKYANSVEIVYTWTEGSMPEGYSLTNTEKNATVTTLTNSYSPEKTSATVKKVWDDAENQDGKRPAELKVTLSNGSEVTLNAANGWTATVNDLPKYANGVEIVYTWTEGSMPEGYNLTNTEKNGTITTLTNSRKVEKITVSGSKTWVGDTEDMRPASITINLLADGVAQASKIVTADDEWKWTFADLDKYKAGREIIYTITEDVIDYYQTEVSGYDVINTRTKVSGKSFPVTKRVEKTGDIAPEAGTYTFDMMVTARKASSATTFMRSRIAVPNESVIIQVGSGEKTTVAIGETVRFTVEVEVTGEGDVWTATENVTFWINAEDADGIEFEVVETGDAPLFWDYDTSPKIVTQDALEEGAVIINRYKEGYVTHSFPIVKTVVHTGDIIPGVNTFFFAVDPLCDRDAIENEAWKATVEVTGNTVVDYHNGKFSVTMNGVGTGSAQVRITYPESVPMTGARIYELTSLDESVSMEELFARGWEYDRTAGFETQASGKRLHRYFWMYHFEEERIVNPDEQDAEQIVFVNTFKATKPIPQTGDSGFLCWAALMTVSAMGFAVIIRRRRNEQENR